jgi:ATP-binding cassette subfamily B protein
MDDLCSYASRPLAFIFRYLRQRPFSHLAILTAVLGAVTCSVGTQYGVKFLVDTLSRGFGADVWTAFVLLVSRITPSSASPAICGAICSATSPGILPITSPISCPAC